MTKLLARTNVKIGSETKLDSISGTVRTTKQAALVKPGDLFEVADEKEAERLIADGAAVDPKEASKEEKDGLPTEERRRLLMEELAELDGDSRPEVAAHRENQRAEEAAVEAAQKAEKAKGKGKSDADDKPTSGKR